MRPPEPRHNGQRRVQKSKMKRINAEPKDIKCTVQSSVHHSGDGVELSAKTGLHVRRLPDLQRLSWLAWQPYFSSATGSSLLRHVRAPSSPLPAERNPSIPAPDSSRRASPSCHSTILAKKNKTPISLSRPDEIMSNLARIARSQGYQSSLQANLYKSGNERNSARSVSN